MASEDTLIGNDLTFQLGVGSPPVFQDMCAVFDFGSIGEEKPLVDVTSLCDNARAYRNGLADGVEIPLQLNFIPGDELSRALYQAYKDNEVPTFRIQQKTSTAAASPPDYFEFAATVRGWNVTGPIGDKSVLSFTLKVSGEVLWVQ